MLALQGTLAPGVASPPPGEAAAKAASVLRRWLPAELVDNPFFSAGFGLCGVGFAAALLRSAALKTRVFAERMLFTSLEIHSKDHSYRWVMQWLTQHCTHTRHLGLETSFSRDSAGHIRTAFAYVPSTGRHWVRYGNAVLLVQRHRETAAIDLQSGTPWETLTLTALAAQKTAVGSLLEEARNFAVKKEEGRTVIFHSVGQDWRPFGVPKRVRPYESVILDDGVAELIHSDVAEFLKSDAWYVSRGIPYRRGYLLFGPPGCGKSSYVMALAGRLGYSICTVNVADPYLTDDRLLYLLATAPPRSLVLLEDIDGAIAAQERESSENERGSNPFGVRRQVTFSGLLNALDGVAATEERLVFMTTNHLGRLPASLVRPGRVDLRVFIGFASRAQICRMFRRFFPPETTRGVSIDGLPPEEAFANTLQNFHVSMADLQNFFMRCKTVSAKDAVRLAAGGVAAWPMRQKEPPPPPPAAAPAAAPVPMPTPVPAVAPSVAAQAS